MSGQCKKILYIDMDGVLVDFDSGIKKIDNTIIRKYEGNLDNIPGIFSIMDPMPGVLEAYKKLSEKFDTYILSTAPWDNFSAWSDKVTWVKKYIGEKAHKRLIITHHKELNRGDYLIDNSKRNGAGEFNGQFILFGSLEFPDWESILVYLL